MVRTTIRRTPVKKTPGKKTANELKLIKNTLESIKAENDEQTSILLDSVNTQTLGLKEQIESVMQTQLLQLENSENSESRIDGLANIINQQQQDIDMLKKELSETRNEHMNKQAEIQSSVLDLQKRNTAEFINIEENFDKLHNSIEICLGFEGLIRKNRKSIETLSNVLYNFTTTVENNIRTLEESETKRKQLYNQQNVRINKKIHVLSNALKKLTDFVVTENTE
ncbi:hypothetical protein PCE1_000447 [Barthelona sp. PCE]